MIALKLLFRDGWIGGAMMTMHGALFVLAQLLTQSAISVRGIGGTVVNYR